MAWPKGLERRCDSRPHDEHSRYIEAMVDGIVLGCLYLPNGNPWPGPRFDYKLRWFQRLSTRAAALLRQDKPVVLAGDYNIIPTDLDVYAPERWIDDALFRPEVRDAFHRLTAEGWSDALRARHPGEKIYTFWKYFRNAFARNAGIRIDHILLAPSLAGRVVSADVDRHVRGWEKQAIMPRCGSNLPGRRAARRPGNASSCGRSRAVAEATAGLSITPPMGIPLEFPFFLVPIHRSVIRRRKQRRWSDLREGKACGDGVLT
jgi:hypothetical protein